MGGWVGASSGAHNFDLSALRAPPARYIEKNDKLASIAADTFSGLVVTAYMCVGRRAVALLPLAGRCTRTRVRKDPWSARASRVLATSRVRPALAGLLPPAPRLPCGGFIWTPCCCGTCPRLPVRRYLDNNPELTASTLQPNAFRGAKLGSL